MSGPVVETIRGTLLSAHKVPTASVSVGTQCTTQHDSVDAQVQCDPMPTLQAIIRDDQDDRDNLLYTIEDLTSSVTQLKQAAGLFEMPGRVSMTVSEAEDLRNKVREQQYELEQLRSLLPKRYRTTMLPKRTMPYPVRNFHRTNPTMQKETSGSSTDLVRTYPYRCSRLTSMTTKLPNSSTRYVSTCQHTTTTRHKGAILPKRQSMVREVDRSNRDTRFFIWSRRDGSSPI